MTAKEGRQAPSPGLGLPGVSLLVLAVVAVGFVLHWLQQVLVPFTLALGLHILLSPVVGYLQRRWRLNRSFAVALVLLMGSALVVGLGLAAVMSMQSFFKGLQAYQAGLQDLAVRLDGWLQLRGLPNSRGLLKEAADSLPMVAWAQQLSGWVINLLLGSALTGLFLVFLLGGTAHGLGQGLGAHASAQVRKYLGVKLALSLLTGILTAGILAWLGVDQALLFGVMAFLLNFVPSLGAAVAVLLPLPLVLLQSGAGSTLALAALLPAGVQMLLGGALEPRLMGRAMGLHPVTVLLGLLVWGSLWGPVGMVLAVPLTSVCRLLFERQAALRPVARWMEGDFSVTVA